MLQLKILPNFRKFFKSQHLFAHNHRLRLFAILVDRFTRYYVPYNYLFVFPSLLLFILALFISLSDYFFFLSGLTEKLSFNFLTDTIVINALVCGKNGTIVNMNLTMSPISSRSTSWPSVANRARKKQARGATTPGEREKNSSLHWSVN